MRSPFFMLLVLSTLLLQSCSSTTSQAPEASKNEASNAMTAPAGPPPAKGYKRVLWIDAYALDIPESYETEGGTSKPSKYADLEPVPLMDDAVLVIRDPKIDAHEAFQASIRPVIDTAKTVSDLPEVTTEQITAYLAKVVRLYKEDNDNPATFRESPIQDITIAGIPAKRVTWSGLVLNDKSNQGLLIGFKEPSHKGYIALLQAPVIGDSQHAAEYEKIALSLRKVSK